MQLRQMRKQAVKECLFFLIEVRWMITEGISVSHSLIAKILDERGYSLQGNYKVKEGADHPDRDAQFGFIAQKTKAFQQQGQPVISVETKKKELLGVFKNGGRDYHRQGIPVPVNVHDFMTSS